MEDTEKTGEGVGGKIKNLEEGAKRVENYVIGIAFVSAFSVLTLLFSVYSTWRDSNQFKAETYQVLVNKVNTLVEQNNTKAEDEKTIKINQLEQEIKDIRTKNPYLK